MSTVCATVEKPIKHLKAVIVLSSNLHIWVLVELSHRFSPVLVKGILSYYLAKSLFVISCFEILRMRSHDLESIHLLVFDVERKPHC